MLHITLDLLKSILSREPLKRDPQLEFDALQYLFKSQYPTSGMRNDSLTLALGALEFVINAEAYFCATGSAKRKEVFDRRKAELVKHFDYPAVLRKIVNGDAMLFLYKPYSRGSRKLSADGVIGKFHSIEPVYRNDNPNAYYGEEGCSNVVIVKLEISNKGIVELPIADVVYFGPWGRKLELIM